MTIDDRDVASWYDVHQLSPEALERLRPAVVVPSPRPWWVVAAALVALGLGYGLWPTNPRVSTQPITAATVPPIPQPDDRTTPEFLIPDGMRRTLIDVADGAALGGFLNPGNYVDVLFTKEGQTQTLLQTLFVLDVFPRSTPRVALLTSPDQDATLKRAAAQGDLVISLRNDLDVTIAAIQGVDIVGLRTRLEGPPVLRSFVSHGVLSDRGPNQAWRTRRRPTSTFALDVDTASYSFSRGLVGHRKWPELGQVRVEEFVNALPYTLPHPEEGDLFGAEVELVPSPWTEGFHLLRVGLMTEPMDADERPPLHLTLLVDASGSMADPLSLVQDTLETLAGELDEEDSVAVVQFSETAEVVLSPTQGDAPVISQAIGFIEAGGGTQLEDGLRLAYTTAAQRLGREGAHRVVLCTDGMPNLGLQDGNELADLVRPWSERGIGLTALGFGRNGYRDALMEAFADASDGNYAYIDGRDWVTHLLVDQFVENFVVVVRDAKAQIRWNSRAVRAWRQVGYGDRQLADAEFRDDTVDAGDLGPGHRVTMLYEVQLASGWAPKDLGTLTLRAEPPGWEGQRAFEQVVALPNTPQERFGHGSQDTRMAAAAASLALALEGSPVSPLSPRHVYWMAHDAMREPFRVEDQALLDFIREVERLPRRWSKRVPGERRCLAQTFVQGAEERVVWLDDDGNPCEKP
ncbi:MAG: von Willebrand factor type A domain-containing protein [Myxococcota bacterium]